MIQFGYPDARVNRDDDPDDSTITAVRVGAGSKSACWPQLSSSAMWTGGARNCWVYHLCGNPAQGSKKRKHES
jgi:hypothetical protein